jgi:hypothetical protein
MTRSLHIGSVAAVALTIIVASRAQPPAPPPRPLPSTVTQAGFTEPPPSAATRAGRDLSQLPPVGQQVYLSAQRGSEWLYRVNQPTGRFLPGWDPALNQPGEVEHFTRQAEATAALARAARFYKNDAYAVRAGQAILTLLAETGPDPRDPTSRCTTAPTSLVNKLGAAGMLLAAIHELPKPAPDLLDQGEQLARYIVRQQRGDGSLVCSDDPNAALDFDATHLAPGQALFGLMRSQQLRPAAWKLDAARKAVGFYRPRWREHRQPALAASMAPACSEAFLQSKDRARDIVLAEFACELADWLCTQQFEKIDPGHPLWRGGFPEYANGKPTNATPTIGSTACARAIIEAARVTRQLPDAERFARYRDAAISSLQFASTLQYTEANTQHFTPLYRQQFLLGGFHVSHDDGKLRLDGTQHAVTAMLAYLTGILDL